MTASRGKTPSDRAMTHDDQVTPPLPEAQDALPTAVRLDELPVALFLLDAGGRIGEANAPGGELLGLAPEVLRGRPLDDFLAPDSRAPFAALLGEVLGSPDRRRGEVRFLHADGTPRAVRLDAVASGMEGGRGRCQLTATELPAAREADRPPGERTATARALNEELEQVVGTFLRQLQAPAGRALSAVGLLRRALGDQPDGITRPLLHIERAMQQIIALFESVNRYMQARQMRARIRPVDLNVVLREVLKDVQPLLLDRSVQVGSDPLPVVQGDSQALSIIFTEYISNALKFTRTREEARLHVRAQETETEYHIGVEDNGVGFDPRGQDRLFRLFGRQHPSSTYEGSGLGLAVIRRVCERFGGRVWGEGRPGEGATFWFAWPKVPAVPGETPG